MRGSPLLRAVLAFLILALAGLPLWRLTRPGNPPQKSAGAAVPAAAARQRVALALTFSAAPQGFAVRHLGQVVWSGQGAGREFAKELSIEYPPEGVDLEVAVEWPEGAGQSAVRLQLADPAGRQHEKTLWGAGKLEDVVTFP